MEFPGTKLTSAGAVTVGGEPGLVIAPVPSDEVQLLPSVIVTP